MATTDWTQDAGMTSDTEVDNIETFVDQAEASATAAASSASSASTSASAASTSASSASASEANAVVSEVNAAASKAAAAASASEASTSASNAATSESNASTSASEASTSASNAAASESAASAAQTAAEAAQAAAELAESNINEFYLGAQASDPTVDGNGDPVTAGDWYFNTGANETRIYSGSVWQVTAISSVGFLTSANNLSDLDSVATARTNLGLGTAATTASTDYATAAQGALADSALQSSDVGVSVQAYDADTAKYDDATANFTGTLQNGGSNVIVDSDIGSTVQAYASNLTTWAGKSAPSGTVVGTTDTQTLTSKTITDPYLIGYREKTYYFNYSVALDPANGTIQYAILLANVTFTDSMASGESITLLINDGTNRTITWPTMKWVGGSAPTLGTSDYNVIVVWKVSTTLYGAYLGEVS